MPRATPAAKAAKRQTTEQQTESAGVDWPPPDTPEQLAAEQAKAADDQAKAVDNDLGFVALDDADEWVNALWYGKEGHGKTTAALAMANLPSPGRVLVVNAESGLKKSALRKRGIDTSQVLVWPDPARNEALTYDALDGLFWRLRADLLANPQAWAGVVFDSLTEIHKALLDSIVATQVAKAAKAGKERDPFFRDRADYGVMTEQIRLLIRRFRDLPCHFAITALERRDIDDQTGKVAYGPALTPALQVDVLGYVDLVLHVEAEQVDGQTEYRASTRASTLYRAKDRYDATPALMTDPWFDRVVGYVTGGLVEDQDPVQQAAAKRRADAAAVAAKKTTGREPGANQSNGEKE